MSRVFSPSGAGFDHDLAKFLLGDQPAFDVHRHLKVHRILHRLLPHHPGRHLDVLLANRIHHIAGGQVSGREFVRIEPDAHRVIARTENLHVPGPRYPGQRVLHLQRGVISQIDVVVTAVGRKQMHNHREIRRLFVVVTPSVRTSSGSFGKACATRFCTCTWALSTSVPSLNVTVVVNTPSPVACEKMYNEPSTPLIACSNGEATVSAIVFGFAPGIRRPHHNRRRDDFRVFRDGQPQHGQQTHDEYGD